MPARFFVLLGTECMLFGAFFTVMTAQIGSKTVAGRDCVRLENQLPVSEVCRDHTQDGQVPSGAERCRFGCLAQCAGANRCNSRRQKHQLDGEAEKVRPV